MPRRALTCGNNNFTIIGWFKRSNTGTENGQLISKKTISPDISNYEIYWADCGTNILSARWTINSGTWKVVCFDTTNTGVWYQFALVHSGNNMYSYLNGIYKNTTDTTGTIDTGAENLLIGKRQTTLQFFNGSIDEVRIWNRSLSAEEVYQLYASNLQKYNQTQWYLYVNQSKNSTTVLEDGAYTSFAGAKDLAGNSNTTETRGVNIDRTNPAINFTNPTPANDSYVATNSVVVNVSINEANLNEVKWNWNGTNFTLYNDSLVLMMNFDNLSSLGENSTRVVDVSKYGNNGTAIGGVVMNMSGGKYGGAAQFDGVDDYIDLSTTSILKTSLQSKEFSISLWLKSGLITGTDNYALFSNSNSDSGIEFILNRRWSGVGQNNLDLAKGGVADQNSPTYVFLNNTWYHIVAVQRFSGGNPSNVEYYVNGISIGNSSTQTSNYAVPTESSYIGKASGGAQVVFNGSIDQFQIWNRSLSAEEVYQLYASNLQKYNQTQWYLYVNQSKNSTTVLEDGAYTSFAGAKDLAGNSNTTETRSITLDTANPLIDFGIGTASDGSFLNQNNVYVNLSVNETNPKNVTFNLFNSSRGLSTSKTYYPGELPDNQENYNGMNMTGNVLLMHMNNDSSVGENATWVYDFSGIGNNGTAYNGIVMNMSGGKYGGAAQFDGVDDYVNATSNIILNTLNSNNYSFSAWMRPTVTGSYPYKMLFSTGPTEYFAIATDAGPTMIFQTNGVVVWNLSNRHRIYANEYYHVVAVREPTQATIYVNGESDASAAVTGTNSNGYFYIGKWSNDMFVGILDEVSIWNRSLSASEVLALYNNSVLRYNHNFTSLADGTYYYNATIFDYAENSNTTATRNITLDGTYPLISFNFGSDNSTTLNVSRSNIFINITASDANKNTVWLNWMNSSGWFNESFAFNSGNNYWVNKTSLGEGRYNFSCYINDSAGNTNNTGISSILVDFGNPGIEFNNGTVRNGSWINYTNFFVNVSLNETNFVNITFTLANTTGIINTTTFSNRNYSINFTLTNEGTYYYNVSVRDELNNYNKTETRTLYYDKTQPNITMYTAGMPSNNSVGGSRVTFNWSVTDNMDSNLSCYPMQGNNELTLKYVENGTNVSQTEILSGGQYELRVRCYDHANNSYISQDSVTYLVAVINVSSPAVNNATYRIGDNVGLFLEELDGTEFLTMTTYRIYNESGNIINTTNGTQSQINNWSLNYTFPSLEPQYLSVRATAFNSSIGESQNVSSTLGMVLLRTTGNTSSPLITKSCPNSTYVLNGSNIIINTIADLDTLIYNSSLIVRDPDGINYTITENSNVKTSGFVYTKNYTFNVNKTGTYFVNFSVEDFEYNNINSSYSFYSASGFNIYKINATTITNMSVQDVCDNSELSRSKDITLIVPEGATYNLNVSIEKSLCNISLELNRINISSNITDIVSYFDLTSEYRNITNGSAAPLGQRRIALFELNSSTNISYSNYTLVYDYTIIESTINNESALKIFKCGNISSCILADINASIDTLNNRITAVLTNMSYFMITENATGGTTSVIETVPTGGSSTLIQTVYKSLNIMVPGTVEIGLKDKIVVPIRLENPETTALKNIDLGARPNTADLSAEFDKPRLDKLDPKTNKTVYLYLESHSTPGEYDVDIYANVSDPKFAESTKLYVKLVEAVGKERIVERIVLAQDLFRENPECLELNDLLIQAEKLLNESKIEESRELVAQAIYKCRDLVTAKESGFGSFGNVKEWKTPLLFVFGFIVIALIVVLLIRKPRIDLYHKKNSENKKGFFNFKRKVKKKTKKDVWGE